MSIETKINQIQFSKAGKYCKKIIFEGYAININTFDYDKPIVFTFDNMDTFRKVEDTLELRKGWGHDFILSCGYNVCSFLENDIYSWYRNEEFLEIVKTFSRLQLFKSFSKRISYGSSMGGYAAAAFANALNVDDAILIHPISTLNQTLCPWEHRFSRVGGKNWSSEYYDSAETVKNVNTTIIYDPLFEPDALHAKRYIEANAGKVRPVKVRGMGHGMPWHLLKLDVLKDLFVHVSQNTYEEQYKREFYTKLKEKKSYVKYYKFMISSENKYITPYRKLLLMTGYLKVLLDQYPKEADLFRELADFVAETNPQVAMHLLERAHRLRPNGNLIKQKLNDLKTILDHVN